MNWRPRTARKPGGDGGKDVRGMPERKTAVVPIGQQPEKEIIFEGLVLWTGTAESPISDRQYEIKTETLYLGVICEASVSGNTC